VQHVAGAIASYLLVRGDIARAASIAKQCFEAARMMGLPHEVVANVERLGLIAARRGNSKPPDACSAQPVVPRRAADAAQLRLAGRP
jgi:hypothetical protein